MADVPSLLLAAQSQDANVRRSAEEQLKFVEQSNLVVYLGGLAAELQRVDNTMPTRLLAGALLKNCFNAQDHKADAQQCNRWNGLDSLAKQQVSQC